VSGPTLVLRRVLSHLVAIAGAWVSSLVASDHFLQELPHWEALIIGGGSVLMAGIIRTDEPRLLPKWWAAFALAVALAGGAGSAYLAVRGKVPLYELALPILPAAVLLIVVDRAMRKRGL
jgi:peptidoglycan/LPS O-acetylase OafA/YrhL